ncbi:MAG: LysM peptidoglycan-binding domain-containing protein [Desulfobacterales bacterium]|nr:LysM peptidoglycan-binding domain-containing protein [Desulfobacterales bacterium]
MNPQLKFGSHACLLALILLGASACTGHIFSTTSASPHQSSVPSAAAKSARENASPPLVAAQVPLESKYFLHTVQGTGETFAAIARWYTGSSHNWVRLAQANPDIDPKRIQIGDTIRIPDEIVTTHQAMPKAVPPAPVARKKGAPAPRTGTELFGPIETPPAEAELFAPIETPPGAGNPQREVSTPALETLE